MSKITETTPSPGSRKAMDLGCKCPTVTGGYRTIFDWDKADFVCVKSCPLHGKISTAVARKKGSLNADSVDL